MGTNSSDLRGLNGDQVLHLIAEYFNSRGMSLAMAFKFLDVDNSGTVTWEEFSKGINLCLQQSGSHMVNSNDLWPIFKRFDKNGDNRINLEEFSGQFCPSAKGTHHQTWYDDDFRTGSTIGYGTPVMSTQQQEQRKADDIIGRIGSAIVRTGFTPQQLFQKVDLDSNGRLSWSELERVIISFQPDLSLTERQMIWRRFDMDGSGDIDIQEFCSIINGANAPALISVENTVRRLGARFSSTGHAVSDIFRVFDRNADGFLSRDEWFRAMRTFDDPTAPLSDADINAVFQRFDLNGDGYMSIAEVDVFFRDAIDRAVGATKMNPGQTWTTGVMPTYVAPPVEQPWETEVLDTVRSCLSVARSGLTITEVFRRLDLNHDETMEMLEFNRMIQAYRPDLTAAHLDSLFRKVNTSNSGAISLSEFVRRFG